MTVPRRRRERAKRAGTKLHATAAWLLGGFAVLAPQLLGGATDVTAAWVLGLGAIVGAFALGVSAPEADTTSRPARAAVVACCIASAWTAVQLLPIPCAWTSQLFAERTELLGTLVALGVRPADALCVLTGAPGSTRMALLLACEVGLLLTAALQLARRGHTRTLAVAIAASSALMALVALGHAALDAHRVFGAYAPQTARTELVLAPLLNGNHLAGHMVLGIPVMLAFAATTRRLDARVGLIALTAAAGACVALALSRGGTGALVLALAMVAAMLSQRDRRRRPGNAPASRSGRLKAVGLGLAAVGALLCAGWEVLRAPFATEGLSMSKLELTGSLLGLIRETPWTGLGRWALMDSTPSITAGTYWVQYAENLPAQWALEWGLPVTLLLLCLFGYGLLAAKPRTRAGAALRIGVLALTAQNLVDFSFELPAVALVSAIAFGCSLGDERPGTTSAMRHLVAQIGVALALATAVLSAWLLPSAVQASRTAQRAALATARAPLEGRPEARAAYSLYPLDPPLILRGVASAVEHDQPNSVAWLGLAMRVAGGWGSTHLLAAHFLEQHGRIDQAAVETSLAAEADYFSVHAYVCYFVGRHPQLEVVQQLAPPGENRRRTMERLLECLRDRPELARQVGAWVTAELPDSAAATVALARAEIMSGELPGARARLDSYERTHGASAEFAAGLLANLNLAGAPADVLTRFVALDPIVQRDSRVLWEAAAAAATMHDDSTLRETIDRLSAVTGSSDGEVATYSERAGRLFHQAGQPGAALRYAKRAYDLRPTPELGEFIYDTATRAGLPLVALHAAHELCQLRHRGEHYCRAAVDSAR